MPDNREILREVLRVTGTTQTELARISGLAQSTISQHLSGRRPLADGTLDRLLSCMGYRLEVERRVVKPELARSERTSWLLHQRYARELTPQAWQAWRPVLERNLESLRDGTRGQPHLRNMDRWQRLIQSDDLQGLRRMMTGLDTDSIEMREVSPVSGLMSQQERAEVLGLDHDKIQKLESKILGSEGRR